MAETKIQSKTYNSTAASTSHVISPNSTPSSGNLLILLAVSDATVNTPSGWSSAVSSVNFTGTYIYYKTSAGSETSITVSPTSSAQTCLGFLEYSGMAASSQLDKTASTTGSSSSIGTGTTATTAQADELLVAITGQSSASTSLQTINSWSNSFVQEAVASATGSGTLVRLGFALRTVSATGAYTTTATLAGSSTGWSGAIATFKIASVSLAGPLVGGRLVGGHLTRSRLVRRNRPWKRDGVLWTRDVDLEMAA